MLVLALFALPICISDWRYRRIPNVYLFFMVYWLIALRIFVPIHSSAVIVSAGVIVALFSLMGMGAGDAKLFVIAAIALNLPNFGALLLFVSAVYIMAILQVMVMWLICAKFPTSIPLAFAIFLGSMLYLAAHMSLFLRQYADALVNSW